jgi:hypothetical protein
MNKQLKRGPKMKKAFFALLCVIMLFGMAATGRADFGEWRGGIRERIHEAEERIDRGIERGALTQREAEMLHRELRTIFYKIDSMKEDGYLDGRERDIINHDLDRLDRDINREKHDSDHRQYDYYEGGHRPHGNYDH